MVATLTAQMREGDMNEPLSQKHKALLALIMRSNADNDGWYAVSKVVTPMFADFPAEIAEIERREDGSSALKPTEFGVSLMVASRVLGASL